MKRLAFALLLPHLVLSSGCLSSSESESTIWHGYYDVKTIPDTKYYLQIEPCGQTRTRCVGNKGRVWSLAFDPWIGDAHIYVGSPSGTVWNAGVHLLFEGTNIHVYTSSSDKAPQMLVNPGK